MAAPLPTRADDADVQKEIQEIKVQLKEMDSLKERLADLERKLAEKQKSPPEARTGSAANVTDAFKESSLKIDGRAFAGFYSSGRNGAYSRSSSDVPDGKLRFSFDPSPRTSFVARLTTARGSITSNKAFDLFYADYNAAPGVALRLGQRKIDFGQETWVDNPVENMLISTSVPHVSGYAPGIALFGRIGSSKRAPLYEAGVMMGPQGQFQRISPGTPFNAKIGVPVAGGLFASLSYFNSGTLANSDLAPLNVAELNTAPSASGNWKRSAWEADLRYNYGSTGVKSMIPGQELPPFMIGATYGRFADDANAGPDRKGDYWFVEGLYNFPSGRTYAAARYSVIDLDNGVLARLGGSPVAVNSYNRVSVGLGYRLSNLTLIKTEYSFNSTSGGGLNPKLDQWSIGLGTKF